MNLPCQKRRRIVIKSSDGMSKEVHRCAHGVCKQYKQEINESICSQCILRQSLPAVKTCKENLPAKPIWLCPYYNNQEIIYPFIENISPPPIPMGYVRKDKEEWIFISEWGVCLYRNFMNKLTPRGDVQIQAYCTVLKRIVGIDECKQCQRDIVKIDGNLNKDEIGNTSEHIPDFPGVVTLLDNYWLAVKRWITAGKPTRTDNDVKKIHEEFCSRCDWYDSKSKRCKGCGCKVKPEGIALLNKIKMATEYCPRNYW